MSAQSAARILALVQDAADERRDLAAVWSMPEAALLAFLRSGEEVSVEQICDASDVLHVPAAYLAGQTDSVGMALALRVGTLDSTVAPPAVLRMSATLLDHLKLLNIWQGAPVRPLDVMDAVSTGFHTRDGQRTAERVRGLLGLKAEPIGDLTELVERLGYPVTHLGMPTGFCGVTARDDRDGVTDRVILINSDEDWARQRFTLAHELGHCLFADAGQVVVDTLEDTDRHEEMRANSFARHLLLPSLALKMRFDAAKAAGVSAEALVAQTMIEFGVSREMAVNALTGDGLVAPGHRALAHIGALTVTELAAAAGLSNELAGRRAGASMARPSPNLSRRAREAHSQGWVHARIVAEVEMRDLADLEAELSAR